MTGGHDFEKEPLFQVFKDNPDITYTAVEHPNAQALFKADAPDKQVATNFKKDCLGCHIPAKAADWVYVQGYPVLKSQ